MDAFHIQWRSKNRLFSMSLSIDPSISHPAGWGTLFPLSSFSADKIHPAARQALQYLVEIQYYEREQGSWNCPDQLMKAKRENGVIDSVDAATQTLVVKLVPRGIELTIAELQAKRCVKIAQAALQQQNLEETECTITPLKVIQQGVYRSCKPEEKIDIDSLAVKSGLVAPQTPLYKPVNTTTTTGVEAYFKLKNICYQSEIRDRTSFQKIPPEVKIHVTEQTSISYKHGPLDVEEANTIAIPSNSCLRLIADYYQQKYGISILIVNQQSLADALLGKGLKADCKCWGIILTSQSELHVVPIICSKIADHSIQAASFDSREADHPRRWSPLLIDRVHWIGAVKGGRQVDLWSCRTDALVILKDALRDLATRNISLDQVLVENPPMLPAQWSKTVQNYKTIPDEALLETRVISKRNQTLREFRARFMQPVVLTEEWTLSTPGAGKPKRIITKTQSQLNLYLNYKGKRYLDLVHRLLK